MSIFDTISAPIKTATKSVYDFISSPIKGIEKFVKAPDNSAAGVIKNTITGIPKATANLAVDAVHSITKNLGSVGLSAGAGKLTGQEEIKRPTAEGFDQKLHDIIFGKQDVKKVGTRINEASKTLETFGLSPGTSKTLAPFGVVGSIALDLYPGSAGESALIKNLVKTGTKEAVESLLKKEVKNITEDVIIKYAPKIAESTDAKAINTLLKEAVEESKTPVQKLATAIKEAKPIREEITSAQSIERAKRFATASETQKSVGGQEGYFQALSKLRGRLTPEGTAFEPVQDKLKPDEVRGLFEIIQQHPIFNFGEQLSAQDGLQRLLEGMSPQPKQLQLLEEAFGRDIIKALKDKRPTSAKIGEMITNIINLPRSLTTTADMSAPFRQGVVLIPSHPIISGKAFGTMLKDFFSEKSFNAGLDALYKSPEYRVIRDSGLYVADPRKIATGLEGREEQFMSNLLENLAGVKADNPALNKALGIVRAPGKVAEASSRAYSSFLNAQRVNVFNDLAAGLKKDGLATPENLKAMANFVNAATGRGSLGSLERNTKLLSSIFFSPKFNASRVKLLTDFANPAWYANTPAPVRKEQIKTMAAFTGTILSILSLAKLGGAEVETDWRSSDFGKIKFGDKRYDITGGFLPWIRVFGQMVTGERKSTTSGTIQDLANPDFGGQSRGDVMVNFFRSKLAPIPGVIGDFTFGKDVTGQPVTIKKEILSKTIPLFAQDVADAVKENGLSELFTTGVPAFFGIGTQTYGNTKSSAASDIISKNKGASILGGEKGTTKVKLPKPSSLPKLKLPKLEKLPPIK